MHNNLWNDVVLVHGSQHEINLTRSICRSPASHTHAPSVVLRLCFAMAFFTAICKFRPDHRCQYKLKWRKKKRAPIGWCVALCYADYRLHRDRLYRNSCSLLLSITNFKRISFFSLKSMLIHDGVWKIWYFFSISASSISLTCKNRVIYHTILGDVAFRSFLHEYIHILFCVFSPLLCQRQCEWRNGRREENLLKKKNRWTKTKLCVEAECCVE